MSVVLEADQLSKVFGRGHGAVHAVRGVSFQVTAGQTFGIVGESGSGKTTLAKLLLRLEHPTSGRLTLDGVDVARAARRERKRLHTKMQVVFQDPYSSMNPRHSVARVLAEGIARVHPRHQIDSEVGRLLELVGLSGSYASRYPHQLSGGQRQRVAIARALSVSPEILVADEPVSALDVSMRGQILNLLAELRDKLGLTTIFISHDLAVVRQFCDSVIVMHRGEVVERGAPGVLLESPSEDYTRRLAEAIPRIPG